MGVKEEFKIVCFVVYHLLEFLKRKSNEKREKNLCQVSRCFNSRIRIRVQAGSRLWVSGEE